ncbi:Isochorismatase-like protein [Mycena vitilis]|nr:Isochorismatase-like protein [Mycena vitilis]
MTDQPSRVALIVVDLQEDFCPPNGSLAVPGGRDIIPVVLKLLTMPIFSAKVATKDWHPSNHISFATNHPNKQPFLDTVEVVHPTMSESYVTRLWPVHCVQGTPGAALVPDLRVDNLFDKIIEKGQDRRVEMYSAFADPFEKHVAESGLREYLQSNEIVKVYVVGLAMDYCVKATALDAVKDFETYIIEDGTRAVDPGDGWTKSKAEMEIEGIKFINSKDVRN